MTAKVTPDELMTTIREGVERVAASFSKPEDDFEPVVFVPAPRGIVLVPLTLVFTDKDTRDGFLFGVLPTILKKLGADTVGWVVSQWRGPNLYQTAKDRGLPDTLEAYEQLYAEYDGKVSKMPGATETVEVRVACRGLEQACSALISRHAGAPPTIGPWEPEAPYTKAEGRLVGALAAATRTEPLS